MISYSAMFIIHLFWADMLLFPDKQQKKKKKKNYSKNIMATILFQLLLY